jgi:hypothetical protein
VFASGRYYCTIASACLSLLSTAVMAASMERVQAANPDLQSPN